MKQVEKDIASLEKKRNKLTDMMLDDKISKEAYNEKYEELNRKLKKPMMKRMYYRRMYYPRKTFKTVCGSFGQSLQVQMCLISLTELYLKALYRR